MRNTPLQIRIIEYANANPMVSYRQISRAIGCHHSAVNDVMLSLEKDSLNRYQDVIAPKVVSTNFFEGNAMITADHHNPCADLVMVQKVIDHAKEHKIKRLFDMGDFFNFDALSNYARKIGGDDQLPRLTDELDFGYGVLKMYSTWFDEIYLMLGNHEGQICESPF